ncbi:MAG: AraC family transcriptional regulator [Nevskiales bacterium]
MKTENLAKPSNPATYGRLILELAEARGVSRETLLAGLNIPTETLAAADGKLSQWQSSQLLYRALQLTRDPALGYAIGLHSNLTSHGFVGFGLMSHRTLREALEFGTKFVQLRTPFLSIRYFTDRQQGVIEVAERFSFGPLRQCTFDLFLVGLWRMVPQLSAGLVTRQTIELWFDYPEPEYYAAYRERLPVVRFSMVANQLRFPAEYLDRPLNAADPATAQLVTRQLERELVQLGYAGDFLGQVRATLDNDGGKYPNLEKVAKRLCISSRTLKRKLQQHGVSFQFLLDEIRRRDSIRLLEDPSLSVEEIAQRVGYTDPANFTRAFRKWLGSPPNTYRARLKVPRL